MAKSKRTAGGSKRQLKRAHVRKKMGSGAFTEVPETLSSGRMAVKSDRHYHGGEPSHPRARNPDPAISEFKVANRYLSTDGLVDVDAVADQFGVTKVMLAQIIGMADETLQRFSRTAAPKTQQRLRDMLEIIGRVEPWAGGLPQALGWYRGQGIPALGDQTAEALVKTDQAKAVREYLDAFAAGAYA